MVGCALVLPVTLARAAGGDQRAPVPLLAAAAPFAVLALAVALALALAGSRRRLAAVPAVLLAVHLAWLAPSLSRDGDPPPAAAPTLTVMTSNAFIGRIDAAALVREVRERRVDVLSVQEITPELVGRLRAAGLERVLPHHVVAARPGASGSALWSRFPARELPPVPSNAFAMPRAALTLSGGGVVHVTAVHPFPPMHDDGIAQWRADMAALRRVVAADGTTPQILAGDFNATQDHGPMQALLGVGPAHLSDAADAVGVSAWPGMTWPSGRRYPPLMRLDHVLVSAGFAVRDVAVLTLPGTDHRAVVARVSPLSGTIPR